MACGGTITGSARKPSGPVPEGFRSSWLGWSAALLIVLPGGCTHDEAAADRMRGTAGAEIHANVLVEQVRIPMRDGTTLGATLVRPDSDRPLPAIVYRTPYGHESYLRSAELPWKAARQGYLVILVDVRGRYASDGTFAAYHQEREDGFDTIEWVSGHLLTNGRVGSYGGSYPGFVQWLALAETPQGYAAAAPAMTPVASHHFFYLGGAFNLTWYDWFASAILPDHHRRAGTEPELDPERWARERQAWYEHRPLDQIPFLEEHAPYYFDWLRNPDLTSWWDFADIEKDFDRIEAPVLLVSGWFDNTYGTIGAIRGFQGMRERSGTATAREGTRLILGPWNHTSLDVHRTRIGELEFGPSAGIDYDDLLLRWFDRHLKGISTRLDEMPPVQVFVMGENRWRFGAEWPLPGTEELSLYLSGGSRAGAGEGALSPDPPEEAEAFDRYTFDPLEPVWYESPGNDGPFDQSGIEGRSDVLVYSSDPLEEPLEVTGEIRAELYVSSSARDTDFAVMISDVHPDGTSYNLMGPEAGYLRMRYRQGYDRQVLMEPDSVYRVVVGNMATSNVFKAGHRIRIHITSSRAPHFDPNPNTGEEIASAVRLVPARQTVLRDSTRPSRIVLPVIPSGT